MLSRLGLCRDRLRDLRMVANPSEPRQHGAVPCNAATLLAVMRVRNAICVIGLLGAAFAIQQPFREYPGIEYNNFPLPPDGREKTEWVFARLMYPSIPGSRYSRYGSHWTEGLTAWTQDYPRADRHFARALRRLTRVHVRSAEQPVNL